MKAGRGLAGVLLGLALPMLLGATAGAADHLSLTIQEDDGGSALQLHCAMTVWSGEPWRLLLAATLPEEITNDRQAYASLTLTWADGDWRWLIAGRTIALAEKSLSALQARGDFERGPWWLALTLGEQDLSEPAAEEGLGFSAAWRCSRCWRLSVSGEYAEVATAVSGTEYERYESEVAATWRSGGAWCRAAMGGRSYRRAEAIDDSRTLYAELDWRCRLDERWTIAGDLRWNEEERAFSIEDESRLGVELTRRAPLSLRLQADYAADDSVWRYGCTFSGQGKVFRWRAGAAGKSGDDAAGAWVYAVLIWAWTNWELRVGLTPKGEYAVNSRKGYWAKASWFF